MILLIIVTFIVSYLFPYVRMDFKDDLCRFIDKFSYIDKVL